MKHNFKIVKKCSHPFDDGTVWVEVIALIRNNETGEVREFKTNEVLEPFSEFPIAINWEKTNFLCDCNRQFFFQRAGGEDESENVACSLGRFSVNLMNPVDGKVYYREFEQ